MIKDQEYLKSKASYCLDLAKKLGATDASVTIGNSISETVNFRNKVLDESNRSDSLAMGIETYIGKKKSSISSSNLLDENLKNLIEKCFENTKINTENKFRSLIFFANNSLSGKELNSSSGVIFVVSTHFSIKIFKLSSNKFDEDIDDFFLPI